MRVKGRKPRLSLSFISCTQNYSNNCTSPLNVRWRASSAMLARWSVIWSTALDDVRCFGPRHHGWPRLASARGHPGSGDIQHTTNNPDFSSSHATSMPATTPVGLRASHGGRK
ncbi:hypothetical protein PR048_011809 [Dryococelus australis]|uniref:Uncharacterized protein n=1 Tax=Dryococelus australis TaxID=614101 RepID=A0ABQ9HMP4_9NEOP|nr:hypothetical protein PR048_011809 [Dryococelus australis]